jgi:hypothetical protein
MGSALSPTRSPLRLLAFRSRAKKLQSGVQTIISLRCSCAPRVEGFGELHRFGEAWRKTPQRLPVTVRA